MRWCMMLLLGFMVIGCSTAPLADYMDWRDARAKTRAEKTQQEPEAKVKGPDRRILNPPGDKSPFFKDMNSNPPSNDSQDDKIPPVPAINNTPK